MSGPEFLTVSGALVQMSEGRLEQADLQHACARQIKRLNPRLNAFITVAPDMQDPTQQPSYRRAHTTGALSGDHLRIGPHPAGPLGI